MDRPCGASDLSDDLTALLGSRICHDLISPLGAIGNGVELLTMSGAPVGPEMALIAQSLRNASARIRFFRLAFGASGVGQGVPLADVRGILDDMTQGARLRIDWRARQPLDRAEVKMAFLAILCLETALPYGGQITVDANGPDWTVIGAAQRTKIDPGLWQRLAGPAPAGALAPAHVQFALLADEARRRGRILRPDLTPARISIGF